MTETKKGRKNERKKKKKGRDEDRRWIIMSVKQVMIKWMRLVDLRREKEYERYSKDICLWLIGNCIKESFM